MNKKGIFILIALLFGTNSHPSLHWSFLSPYPDLYLNIDEVIDKKKAELSKYKGYYQCIINPFRFPIEVTFDYHSCKPDAPIVVPSGGSAMGNPKGCLLKRLTIKYLTEDPSFDRYFKFFPRPGVYNFSLGEDGTAHGLWIASFYLDRVEI